MLMFSGASAFSVCSAVEFKDIYGNFTVKLDCARLSFPFRSVPFRIQSAFLFLFLNH
nr:hypothetical protein GZ19A5_2 [uncultured archaeon GZfos19A5]